MHPITKKRLRRWGRNLPPTCPQLSGRRVSNRVGFFSHPSISSFPASPRYRLTEPTASAQSSRKPRGAGRQGSLPAVLIACVHSPVQSFPYVSSGDVRTPPLLLHMEPFFFFFFPKTQRELDVSGEGKLTLHLIFKLQHFI